MDSPSVILCACGQRLVPDGASGRPPAACPHCGRPVELLRGTPPPAGSSGAAAEPQLPKREAPKPAGNIPLRCPRCSKVYSLPPPRPGARAFCRACKAPLEAVLAAPAPAQPQANEAGAGLQPVMIGETVDPAWVDLVPGYRIERRLGAGAESQVFLARQKSLDRRVAIRVLSRRVSDHPPNVDRFLAEARAGAKLSQENVAVPITAGQSNGFTYLVTEYVEGDTLEELLRRGGALPERRALEIARQIASGLAHAWQHGLAHRDLRPANVRLTLSGTAKVLDFGLARGLGQAGGPPEIGAARAHPAYASPEQCRGVPELSAQSDMYSLGAILFEMLTGQPPFKGDAPASLLVQQVVQSPPSPRTLVPALSAATEALVLRLLRKSPAERFKDYGELLAAVVEARGPGAADKAVPPAASAGRRDPLTTLRAWPGRRWGAVIGAVALGVVSALALFSRSGGRPVPAVTATPSDGGAERALAEARAFDKANRGRPGEIPAVRQKWKDLAQRYRGTPSWNAVAGSVLEFEARVARDSAELAEKFLKEAQAESDAGRPAAGWFILRGFPPGLEGTSGADKVKTELGILEHSVEQVYQEGREAIAAAFLAGRFDEALSRVESLRAAVSAAAADRIEYVRSTYGEELDAQARRIGEERRAARLREEEALAKKDPDKPPASPPAAPPAATGTVVDPTMAAAAPRPTAAKPPAPSAPAVLLPVPDPGRQKESEKLIRELFGEEFQKRSAADRAALGRRLIDLGLQTQGDPVGRYVLFDLARETGILGANSTLAFEAIERLAREYQVNAAALRGTALLSMSQAVRFPDEVKAVSQKLFLAIDELLKAEDFDGAGHLVSAAIALGRRTKDVPLVSRADQKLKECDEARERFAQWKKASEALAANPADPAASFAAGYYLAISRGDWTQGLLLLSRGSDPSLRALATKDLVEPVEAAAQMALADEWWEAADKESSALGRDGLRRRAGFWYQKALPGLSGFRRTKVQKRMAEAGIPAGLAGEVDLLRLIDPQRDTVNGSFRFDGESLVVDGRTSPSHIRIEIPGPVPDEYDLIAVVEKFESDAAADFFLGLVFRGRQFTFSMDAYGGAYTGIFDISGMGARESGIRGAGGIFQSGVSRMIRVSVREDSFRVTVDGKENFAWKPEWTRVSNGGPFGVRHPGVLFVGALTVPYRVKKLVLIPVAK